MHAAQAASQPADSGVKPVHLNETDRADVMRIESYLNNLKNISADFLQIGDNGEIMRGTIAIQRPGKMRVNYDPPSKDFIIADGTSVHPVKLSGDVTITKFQRFPAKLEMTLVQTNDAGAGQLTLVFEDRPLKLRQWKVLDPQGRTTGVNLENVREDITFPAKMFYFVPPNFGNNPNSAAP
jgi:outer membrane lipoprotein-sorting protein